jgi:homoserine O-acetyltransferase
MADHLTFDAGDLALQSGKTLKNARIAYQTHGELNAAKDNAILICTAFGARHTDVEWMIGPGKAIDPAKHFIVVPNQFGNGLSSSPSDSGYGGDWADVTLADNIAAQRKLLQQQFGITRLKLVCGWSMGGMQTYHWAALYPGDVERAAVLCGSAKTAPHNQVFLEGVKAVLCTDAAFQDGRFVEMPQRGLRSLGRFYAGWALSQTFYREELWRATGATSLEGYLVEFWEKPFQQRHAGNILAQALSWQRGDISDNPLYKGNLVQALQAIEARTLLMPGSTDLYFTVEDNRREALHLRNAELLPIPSDWGHRAGAPFFNKQDADFIDRALARLLAEPAR